MRRGSRWQALNQQIFQFQALLNPDEALAVSRERAEEILRKLYTHHLLGLAGPDLP